MSGLLKNSYVTALVSFAALARFKRMSDAVEFLGVSRQTIGRHMDFLDENLGGPVMKSAGRYHELTSLGESLKGSADTLLQQVYSMSGTGGLRSLVSDGLQQTWLKTEDSEYLGQQHPLWRVYDDSPELIQKGFDIWKSANLNFFADEVQDLLPYVLTYRHTPSGWVCMHVGEKSAYAEWFGWEWAKSAVGALAGDAVSGSDYFRFTSVGFLEVMNTGSCRLDHHQIKNAVKGPEPSKDVNYHRLTMSFVLPNKAPILATLVSLSDSVDLTKHIEK